MMHMNYANFSAHQPSHGYMATWNKVGTHMWHDKLITMDSKIQSSHLCAIEAGEETVCVVIALHSRVLVSRPGQVCDQI